MMNIKKLMIILVLTLFIVQIAYASDNNESVSAEINDVVIEEIIEIDETNEEVLSKEENVDQNINDFVVEDNIPPEEYIDSNINNSYEKSLEVEISEDQCYTYLDEFLDKSQDSNIEFDETDNENYSSINNYSYNTLSSYELFVCNKLEFNFEINYLNDYIFKFDNFKYDAKTLDCFTYTNQHCCVLTHAVKSIIFCSDKLNSNFVYSIDNSIVGNQSNFYHYFTNFSIINYLQYSQYFSTSQYFFTSFYLTGCVYDFFSVLNNRINEVCSFRI